MSAAAESRFERFAHFDAAPYVTFSLGGFVLANSTRAMRANGLVPSAVADLLHAAFNLDDPENARYREAFSAFERYARPVFMNRSTFVSVYDEPKGHV